MPASRTLRNGELLAVANFTGITATTLLTFDNSPSIDLGDIDIANIVLESEITAIAGTSPTARTTVLTSNKPSITVDSPDALQGDGSTVFRTGANQTAVGTAMVGWAPQASTGATASNVGKYLGVEVVVGGTTPVISGEVRLYVKGK